MMIRPIEDFKDPANRRSEYAPRSVRPANQQRSPAAMEGEFPRSMRHTNQQGRPGAENEIPRVGRILPRDAKLWRKSLAP